MLESCENALIFKTADKEHDYHTPKCVLVPSNQLKSKNHKIHRPTSATFTNEGFRQKMPFRTGKPNVSLNLNATPRPVLSRQLRQGSPRRLDTYLNENRSPFAKSKRFASLKSLDPNEKYQLICQRTLRNEARESSTMAISSNAAEEVEFEARGHKLIEFRKKSKKDTKCIHFVEKVEEPLGGYQTYRKTEFGVFPLKRWESSKAGKPNT
eukprot:Platyproteum_vivax@DN10268_c0_g1_i1.p1